MSQPINLPVEPDEALALWGALMAAETRAEREGRRDSTERLRALRLRFEQAADEAGRALR